MPKLLVDQDTFPGAISVPVNGDPRDAVSLEVPFQGLANRTRSMRSELDSGIRRIREVADKTALLALVGVKTGDFAYVGGLGLYRFQVEDSSTDWSPGIIASPAQGGRWWNAAITNSLLPGGVLWAHESGAVFPANLMLGAKSLALSGPMTKIGPTAVTHERVHVVPTDGDKTITVADGDVIFAYGSMSDNRTYTLATPTGATPQIRVVNSDSQPKHVYVRRASDNVLIGDLYNNGINSPTDWAALFQHSSMGWKRIG